MDTFGSRRSSPFERVDFSICCFLSSFYKSKQLNNIITLPKLLSSLRLGLIWRDLCLPCFLPARFRCMRVSLRNQNTCKLSIATIRVIPKTSLQNFMRKCWWILRNRGTWAKNMCQNGPQQRERECEQFTIRAIPRLFVKNFIKNIKWFPRNWGIHCMSKMDLKYPKMVPSRGDHINKMFFGAETITNTSTRDLLKKCWMVILKK